MVLNWVILPQLEKHKYLLRYCLGVRITDSFLWHLEHIKWKIIDLKYIGHSLKGVIATPNADGN